MTARSHIGRLAITSILLFIAGSIGSFYGARRIANRYVGDLPRGLTQTHHGFIPFRRYPPSDRWGWVISYDDANEDGFEIYVTPFGRILGTNPPGLRNRLPLSNGRAAISTAPPDVR
ncbi:MAG: hypothetical protein ACREOJ_00015 [Gemmatimonadaceae bacterium]